MDLISEERLGHVHPKLAAAVRAAAEELAGQGIFFRVAQGLRTYAEQDALYALGRTELTKPDGTPQPIVTNARGGWSNHNFGCAVDCYPFVHGSSGKLDLDDPNTPEFQAMVAALKGQGLAWGGDWKHICDEPHFQLADARVTPDDVDRMAFRTGGLYRVWAQYG